MPTVEQALRQAEKLIRRSDAVEHPHAGKERIDAEELMEFVLGRDIEDVDQDEELPSSAFRRFQRLVGRRLTGEPPAYITGHTRFHGLTLEVRPGAFIPRESSEHMADQAIRRLRARIAPVHVDLATGVGPVALAIAKAVPRARVFGIDLYAEPVRQAGRNALRLGLSNATFMRGDLFDPVPADLRRRVDVVTIHPPYIPKREIRTLPHEILGFEPRESLTDFSRDGTGLLGRVMAETPGWLRPGGWLLVEVSPDRSRGVATALRRGGFSAVRSTRGVVAVSRVIVGRA